MNKISEIANLLEKEGIRVYGYTARTDLDYTNIKFIVNINIYNLKLHTNTLLQYVLDNYERHKILKLVPR